jgi:TolA-binding protein
LTLSGKPADAVKILTQLAGSKETRSDAVLYDLAWAQRAGGDAKGATGTYEALIKEFPGGMRVDAARVELPELYSQDDRTDEAVALLSAALADPNIDPRSRAVALYRLGAGRLRQGEGEKAGAAFDQFVMENPNDPLVPGALAEAGAAYTQAEKFDMAETRLNKVLTLFANTDAAKLAGVRMGDLQNQQQQYEKAAGTFDAWMKGHPKDALLPMAEFGMGWSLENRGKFEEARGWYGKVIEADRGATGARAQFQIGETYFKEKKFETAAKELLTVDILYKVPEWSAPALYEAGCAFSGMGDEKRAREQWEECLKKYPKSAVAGMAKKKLEGK